MLNLEWISDRELAGVVWLAGMLSLSLLWHKTRPQFLEMFRLLVSHPLVTIVLFTGIFCFGGLLVFEPTEGWDNRALWLATLWFLTVGIGQSFKAASAEWRDWASVKEILFAVISATAIFDFIVNFRSFSLAIELILLPVLFLSLYISKSPSHEHDWNTIRKVASVVLFVVVVASVAVSLSSIYEDPSDFFSRQNIVYFSLPFILAIFSAPMVAIVFLVTIYETILSSVRFAIHDHSLVKYAQRQAVFHFNINVGALERWRHLIHIENPTTKEAIDKSVAAAIAQE